MCGIVEEVGRDAEEQFAPGDRVTSISMLDHLSGHVNEKSMTSGLGLPLDGVLCNYQVFPYHGLLKVPEYLSNEQASCLPVAALSAWMSINCLRPIGQHVEASVDDKKPTVLLQGTGGVSIAGLQIAKACGLGAIVTSSSDEKLKRAIALGADFTINYKSNPDWHTEVMKLTEGRGVDIVFENGGARTLHRSFQCLAFGGLISCIGYLAGKDSSPEQHPPVNMLALQREATLRGIQGGPKDRLAEMLKVYEAKEIKPVIDRTFPFDQSKEALQWLLEGEHFSKVVITM